MTHCKISYFLLFFYAVFVMLPSRYVGFSCQLGIGIHGCKHHYESYVIPKGLYKTSIYS